MKLASRLPFVSEKADKLLIVCNGPPKEKTDAIIVDKITLITIKPKTNCEGFIDNLNKNGVINITKKRYSKKN